VSQGKIEPLIDEARKRAHAQSHAELQAFIEDIDARFYVLEREIDEKVEQIQQRLRKLEEASGLVHPLVAARIDNIEMRLRQSEEGDTPEVSA
jgi:hypothetical protein